MNSAFNHNTNSNCLSEKQLIGILDGNLSETEDNTLSDHISSCELCSTAIEGYKKTKFSGSKITELNSSLKSSFRPKRDIGFTTYFLTGVGLTAIIIYFLFNPNSELKNVSIEKAKPITSLKKLSEQKVEYEAFYVNSIESKKEESITSIIQETTHQAILKEHTEQKREETIPEKIPLKQVEITHYYESNFPKPSGLRKTLSIGELHQFKIIDYSKEYNRDSYVIIPSMNSISAKKEEKHDEQTRIIEYGIKKPYIEVLSQAIEYMKVKNLYTATVYFNYILNMDNENQNAIFYAGLCNYNMKKHNNAISAFNKIIETGNQTFMPEARWYKAKALIAKGKNKKAKIVLQEIIENDGFYTNNAKSILLSLR
jgi:TolA-binding protein